MMLSELRLYSTREYVVGGSNISNSMASAGFFPNLVVKMIQVGEESGSLPECTRKSESAL